MLHKFRVQYILIDFSDNGFLVSPFNENRIVFTALSPSGYYESRCCLMCEMLAAVAWAERCQTEEGGELVQGGCSKRASVEIFRDSRNFTKT